MIVKLDAKFYNPRHAEKIYHGSGARKTRRSSPRAQVQQAPAPHLEQARRPAAQSEGRSRERRKEEEYVMPFRTKEERAQYQKRWYQERRAQLIERSKKNYADHRSERKLWSQEHYQKNRSEIIKRSREMSAGRRAHCSAEELQRLRIPENRMQALRYGPAEKSVCLNCGLICDNLSSHVVACLVMPEPKPVYKEHWGYNRSTPLGSARWRERASKNNKCAEFLLKYRETGMTAFDAERKRRSAAKQAGGNVSRGRMRLQARLARRGRRFGGPPFSQKVSTERVLEILALNLPLTEAAKRIGITRSALAYRARRLGWDTKASHTTRQLLTVYCGALRGYLRAAQSSVSVQQIVKWHAEQMSLKTNDLFHRTARFFDSIKRELEERPESIKELVAGRVVIVASRIFTRVWKASERRTDGRRSHAERTKKVPKYVGFAELVATLLPNIRQAHAVVAAARKASPTNSSIWVARLREANCPEGAIPFVILSRTARVAAIRYAAQLQKIKLKTAQNLFSQYLASGKVQRA
jgi:hypothetical protein